MSLSPESVTTVSRRHAAPVVVGLDGSEASIAALRWAADEAATHQAPLVAVHVHDPRSRSLASYAPPGSGEPAALGESALVERTIVASGVTGVSRVFETGVPSQVLVRYAIGARMLVLGHADQHRHRDGETFHHGPALGSIARACVARATCPVVVIPIPVRCPVPAAAEPEPKRLEAAQSTPVVGHRAIYPQRQLVPIAHGWAAPVRKEANR